MRISGKTDIGCNRAENQDTFRSGYVPGGGGWGLVCDGMGGAQNGRLASLVAADSMEETLFDRLREQPECSAERLLRDAVKQANTAVYSRSGEGSSIMGTTVVSALIRNRVLYLAHVGDSRAYIYQGGRLKQVTRDHSMVQELVDMGTITSAEARSHPEKNVITRALGVEEEVVPSYSEQPIDTDNVVLLCTDGLTNMVSFEHLEEMFATVDFYDLARELVNEAIKAGGDDNITVLLMKPEERDW